jgi:hypothetical protein
MFRRFINGLAQGSIESGEYEQVSEQPLAPAAAELPVEAFVEFSVCPLGGAEDNLAGRGQVQDSHATVLPGSAAANQPAFDQWFHHANEIRPFHPECLGNLSLPAARSMLEKEQDAELLRSQSESFERRLALLVHEVVGAPQHIASASGERSQVH